MMLALRLLIRLRNTLQRKFREAEELERKRLFAQASKNPQWREETMRQFRAPLR